MRVLSLVRSLGSGAGLAVGASRALGAVAPIAALATAPRIAIVTAAAVRLHGQQQTMATFLDEVQRDGWHRVCPAGLNANPRKIWLLLGGGLAVSAAAQQPSGKAAKKKALLDWFHGALKDDTDDARADFLKARDYTAVANVIRKHARAPKHAGAHADAIKLLDNKGHLSLIHI